MALRKPGTYLKDLNQRLINQRIQVEAPVVADLPDPHVPDDEEVPQHCDGQREEEGEDPDEDVEEVHQEEASGDSDEIGHRIEEGAGHGVEDQRRMAKQADNVAGQEQLLDGPRFLQLGKGGSSL